MDDTLIQSTSFNNDAYNYVLEKFGYSRIKTKDRITREKLNFLPFPVLRKVIREKQKYFTSEWLPYRTTINCKLIESIVSYGKENCYLWTKASKRRVESILKYFKFNELFNGVIFDNKVNFYHSINKLKALTNSNEFIIYENNHKFFNISRAKIIEHIKATNFDVAAYLIFV